MSREPKIKQEYHHSMITQQGYHPPMITQQGYHPPMITQQTYPPSMITQQEYHPSVITEQKHLPEMMLEGASKPSVTITESISFQNFRYSKENRPGKKYQGEKFMVLQLHNLHGKRVRVVIIPVTLSRRLLVLPEYGVQVPENEIHMHHNGLVGKDCHDGIYDKLYDLSEHQYICSIKIPYIRIERLTMKKSKTDKVIELLRKRTDFLPSPWRERFMAQDTTMFLSANACRVHLAVILTVESSPGRLDKPLYAVSGVIKDGNKNTTLVVTEISNTSIPAKTGGFVYIFTAEASPQIEPGRYKVYVTYEAKDENKKLEHWSSEEKWLSKSCIMYGKVIRYYIPPFEPDLTLNSRVEATLHLSCPESKLHCNFPFVYVPQGDAIGVRRQPDMDSRLGIKRSHSQLDYVDNDDCDDEIRATVETSVKMKSTERKSSHNSHMMRQTGSQVETEKDHHETDVHKQNSLSMRLPIGQHLNLCDKSSVDLASIADMQSSKSSNGNDRYISNNGQQLNFEQKRSGSHLVQPFPLKRGESTISYFQNGVSNHEDTAISKSVTISELISSPKCTAHQNNTIPQCVNTTQNAAALCQAGVPNSDYSSDKHLWNREQFPINDFLTINAESNRKAIRSLKLVSDPPNDATLFPVTEVLNNNTLALSSHPHQVVSEHLEADTQNLCAQFSACRYHSGDTGNPATGGAVLETEHGNELLMLGPSGWVGEANSGSSEREQNPPSSLPSLSSLLSSDIFVDGFPSLSPPGSSYDFDALLTYSDNLTGENFMDTQSFDEIWQNK